MVELFLLLRLVWLDASTVILLSLENNFLLGYILFADIGFEERCCDAIIYSFYCSEVEELAGVFFYRVLVSFIPNFDEIFLTLLIYLDIIFDDSGLK